MFDILDDADLRVCLEFIVKADALKKVLRKTYVIKNERPENTAEHSWHLGLMAIVLRSYAKEPVNMERVLKMLIFHDIGEIDVGDTFLFDVGRAEAEKTERLAVENMLAPLPLKLRQEFMELWLEFAEGMSAEARFARAMDRFQPFLSNIHNEGGTWKSAKITKEAALAKCRPIGDGSATLWQAYQKLADHADKNGLFHRA